MVLEVLVDECEFTLWILAKMRGEEAITHAFANPLLDVKEDVVATLSTVA